MLKLCKPTVVCLNFFLVLYHCSLSPNCGVTTDSYFENRIRVILEVLAPLVPFLKCLILSRNVRFHTGSILELLSSHLQPRSRTSEAERAWSEHLQLLEQFRDYELDHLKILCFMLGFGPVAKHPKDCRNYQSSSKQPLSVDIPHVVHKNEGIQEPL